MPARPSIAAALAGWGILKKAEAEQATAEANDLLIVAYEERARAQAAEGVARAAEAKAVEAEAKAVVAAEDAKRQRIQKVPRAQEPRNRGTEWPPFEVPVVGGSRRSAGSGWSLGSGA